MPVQHFAHPQRKGRNLKRLRCRFLLGIYQPMAQQPVHRTLEGVARAPPLLLHERGNVVVYGEGGSHIMMLDWKAS